MAILDKEKLLNATLSLHSSKPSSWVEINSAAFNHNIAQYKSIVAPALLAPVIKSNAYGHGIEIIAQLCEQNAHVDVICVASLTEALRLRERGIQKPILVLSIIDADMKQAVIHDIDVVVSDMDSAHELNLIGYALNKKAKVHIKIDTGLSRNGFFDNTAVDFVHVIYTFKNIKIRGIFTHFASSENEDQTFTHQQIDRFNFLIDCLAARDMSIPLRHTSCSAATTANARSHHTMARVGIGIYGLWPSAENKKITQQNYPHFSLRPVMTWKTRIMLIKEIPAGSSVGYDQTFVAPRRTCIALLPVGYWDGYDRGLSNTGKVLVHGKLVPVIGRVAMNLTVINITDVRAAVGDEVTLLGPHAGVTAEEVAAHCGTINYEIVTRINPLLPRVVKE